MTKRTVIIGVGGPVGSGKTLLLEYSMYPTSLT